MLAAQTIRRRKTRPGVIGPGGLAMPRGPTGSRHGLDALGSDGGIPAMVTPTYGSTAATSFTPCAEAADFLDSLGINVHPTYTGLSSETQQQTAIDRIKELGFRHVRGLGLFNPSWKADEFEHQWSQFWLINCINATKTRQKFTGGPAGVGEQPIFNLIGLDEREYFTNANAWAAPQAAYEIFDADGGEPFYRALDGPPARVASSGTNYTGNFYSINKGVVPTDPPIGWSGVSSLSGPNEPEGRNTRLGAGALSSGDVFYGDTLESLTPSTDRKTGGRGIRWLHRQHQLKRQSQADTVILNGEEYIDFNTGRINREPATMRQLPIQPFGHFVGGGPPNSGWQKGGDYTDADYVSFHTYWSGTCPMWDFNWGNPTDQQWPNPSASASFGWMHNADVINGINRGDTIRFKFHSTPIWQTEAGWYQYPSAPAISAGQYCPPHISGEYLIQNVVMNYLQGCKRTFVYKLTDEGGDNAAGSGPPAMGLCRTDFTKKESFHAMKNLAGIVRWRQGGQDGDPPQFIQIPHNFTPGQAEFADDLTNGNQTPDICYKLVLRTGTNQYLIIICRPRQLWSRQKWQQSKQAGNTDAVAEAAGARVPNKTGDVTNVTLTLPAPPTGYHWETGVCEPAKNPIRDPSDGQFYANANNGQAFAPPGVTNNGFTQSNNILTLRVCGLTRAVSAQLVPDAPTGVTSGITATTDRTKTSQAAQSIGADLVRINYDIATVPTTMDADFLAYTPLGVRVLPVATFTGRTPTTTEAQNLANWVNRFGPGGSFWAAHPELQASFAIKHIEFGDDTSYNYQYGDVEATPGAGDWWNSTTYQTRAANYATRFREAHIAVQATGRAVGLLCIGEDGGSADPMWVNKLFDTVTDIASRVAGWSTKGFSPQWEGKIDRLVTFTGNRGAAATIPIDITSLGQATDNGNVLNDNISWPPDQTYAQAASAIDGTISTALAKPNLASRLRYFIIRQAHDLTAPGANNVRDNYFGVLTNTLGEKAEYSARIREQFGGTPPPPPPPPPPTTLPIVVPSSGSTAAALRTGSTTGPRLHLRGVNVWGTQDSITTSFGAAQYQNRTNICATIKSWGANCVRFRFLASDWNKAPIPATGQLTKAQIIAQIKDWRDAVTARGMYFIPCSWDALDGDFDDVDWPGNAFRYHQMFTDIKNALGNDPMVMYEPTNEPNLVGYLGGNGHDANAWNAWDTNMRSTILHFRETLNYKGVLIIDPLWWANSGGGGEGYDDARYTALENYDAARAGMNGIHQLVFAKHDYANGATSFNQAAWIAGAGANQIKHLIWENEFGNYNGSPSTVNATWSDQAATFFGARFNTQQNFCGGCAFLWGPWFDANALTASNNVTPTNPWGETVRTKFFGGAVTPPSTGFRPGVVGNAADGNDIPAGQSLNAKVIRLEWGIGTAATSIDGSIIAAAQRGLRVLMLAGFSGFIPSVAQAQNLATWASRFGAGGAFWQAHPELNANLAVTDIEFGNETSFSYQYGNQAPDPAYRQRASDYASRWKSAYDAIQATGRPVRLLCQADHGGSGLPDWVNFMFNAVPNLGQLSQGWVVHPYGPNWKSKTDLLVSQTAARGAPNNIPIDITEWGIASDNGGKVYQGGREDNYGYGTALTYQQCADLILPAVNAMRNDPNIGFRIRHWLWYRAHDTQPPGRSNNPGVDSREIYFGALKSDNTEKGNIGARIRDVMAMT